jgi:hypothetical protein
LPIFALPIVAVLILLMAAMWHCNVTASRQSRAPCGIRRGKRFVLTGCEASQKTYMKAA